jgi:hypothetical protein
MVAVYMRTLGLEDFSEEIGGRSRPMEYRGC